MNPAWSNGWSIGWAVWLITLAGCLAEEPHELAKTPSPRGKWTAPMIVPLQTAVPRSDLSRIDRHALRAPRHAARSLDALAAHLASAARDERETARAIFRSWFVDFDPVTCSPRPLQARLPIIVGGDTPQALRRAARLGDGYFPGTSDPQTLAKLIAELRAEEASRGRAPGEIEVSAIFGAQMADPVAGARQLAELGVGRAMVPAFFFAGPGGLDRLSEFGEKVVRPSATAEC